MKKVYKRICLFEGCKKEFETTNPRRFYCSDSCQRKNCYARKTGRRLSDLKVVTCDYCGKEFKQRRLGQRFCCYECKQKKYKTEKAEYNKQYELKRSVKRSIESGRLKIEKRVSNLNKRAAIQKQTGLSEAILQAYKDNPEGLTKITKYRQIHGLSKPCEIDKKRVIGHIYIV